MRVICHLATRVGVWVCDLFSSSRAWLDIGNSEMTEMTVSFSLFED